MQEPYQKHERVFFLPIGGTAMASLAGLLHAAGHTVSGVDADLYPPMSTLLRDLDIPVRLGWDPRLVPNDIDRVIIGNAVPKTNPEVAEVLRRGLPYTSQAEAVARYLLTDRRSIVVAGTHGKTTTTAMLAWILERCGADPTELVGGLLPWSRRSFRLGRGPWLVIEGDEYNTSFFDRSPKFLHYRPHVLVLGPVEFDHADIYEGLDAVMAAFRAGVARVPEDGAIVVDGRDAHACEVTAEAVAPVRRVGESARCDIRLDVRRLLPEGGEAVLSWDGRALVFRSPLAGRHNIRNAALALTAACEVGVQPEQAAAAVSTFPGVGRRLEIVGEAAGVTLVDDFAHHPTAVAATIEAARQRWPARRLVIVYEPRSLSAGRRELHDAYLQALSLADVAVVLPVYHRDRLGPENVLDRAALARDLSDLGVPAVAPASLDRAAATTADLLAPGDVMVACSSGSLEDLHQALVARLSEPPPDSSTC